MISVCYFAALRKRIGCSAENVAPPAVVDDVAALVDWLACRSPAYADAFRDRAAIRAAVNQVLAEDATAVAEGDEVAFFLPVTGT